jgi:hypothetical protein
LISDLWRENDEAGRRLTKKEPSMRNRTILGALALVATIVVANSAHAVTTQECRSKYKMAKSAGTLHGMKWSAFRRSECALKRSGHLMPGERPASLVESWGAPTPGSMLE